MRSKLDAAALTTRVSMRPTAASSGSASSMCGPPPSLSLSSSSPSLAGARPTALSISRGGLSLSGQ